MELINGVFYTGSEVIRNGRMRVDADGRIAYIGSREGSDPDNRDAPVVDLAGRTVVPGFIDVHIHGGGGWDLLRGNPEDFEGTARFHAAHGTTAFLATIGPNTEAETVRIVDNARKAQSKGIEAGAEVIGVHLEGPFLNPLRKGAMNESMFRPPDIREMDRYIEASGNTIRLITTAPELPGGEAFVRGLVDRGIRVSVGHSDASYEQMADAVRWGASHTTHHFNGMRPFHHRDPGTAGAGLMMPELTTELIADGVHVHPAAVRFLFDVKGEYKVCAVTDAIAYAGMPDGEYGHSVVTGGEVYLKGTNTLAGSSLTMLKALHLVMQYTGRPLERVLPSFTAVPARQAGVDDRKGTLEPGKDADFLILGEGLELLGTYVRGICAAGA
ncbi:N-acetylglucosamine-6-phosphate deacetylase [Cohnella kolymensis]|uniref:N-acetylglucosamine-6-phosphate deacetylase n=1 Tax=Cohnella kolymensis TaxID=1590652 RepID=UPI00069751B8|nr:N-acetylglucosamine-6-phosphate deacetylase [Cohnella kolymensis]